MCLLYDRIIFLCSGGGGNLRFAHRMVELKRLGGIKKISVIADRSCYAYEWAIQNRLEASRVEISTGSQIELYKRLSMWPTSLVITNIHKVLSKEICDLLRGRLINQHYSLLPAFAGTIGMTSLSDAVAYGCTIVGATVHHVTETLDGGRPISQAAFTTSNVQEVNGERMFRAGCLSLYNSLISLLGSIDEVGLKEYADILGTHYLVSPKCSIPEELYDEAFWAGLK